jgi:hypothetical protein
MTPDNHIREALTLTPHSEVYKEVRFLLHQALGAFKEAQIKDPRIVKVERPEPPPLAEATGQEEGWCPPEWPQSKKDILLKEFGW